MTITDLNKKSKSDVENLLSTCCGASKWSQSMCNELPFKDEGHLIQTADRIWVEGCAESDWQEAFTHHPKIGDIKSLTEKFASTQHLAGKEQSGVDTAAADVIASLAIANQQYELKFGFIFIVCATGKSAMEMLQLLNDRLKNSKEEELLIAMGEQQKITLIRLKQLLSNADWSKYSASQITTHVLDTSTGIPGKNISIQLKKEKDHKWITIAQGITNADGRISDLLPASRKLTNGNYQMVFNTGDYFTQNKVKGFYPTVEIQFTVFDQSHYHVPLLINPFGYSTYRGS